MTAPRRVLLVLHKFSRGGSDRVAAYLARGFTDLGMTVELAVFAKGGEVEAILSEIVGTDIPIRYLGRSLGWRPLDLIAGVPKLAALLRASAPDTIISTANNTAWASAAALKLSGIRGARLFLKTTNPIARSRHRGLVRRIRQWGYRKTFALSDGVWALSAEERDELKAEYPGFADLFAEVFNPYVTPAMLVPRPGATVGGAKTVVGVGRLTAQKRFDRLIAAFARVAQPGVRLAIHGEGEDRDALTAQIATLDLADRVSLPGYTTDVAGVLNAADLMVLPSDYEGLPAVVLEAMAANCPVLATDCFPAARSIVGGTEGCAIIERTDPVSLAALIDAHLREDRPTHLRAVAARYSIDSGVASHVAAMRLAPRAPGHDDPGALRARVFEVLRFGIVGSSNTAITWLIFMLLVHARAPLAVANAVGWCAGGVSGFLLNRSWTFRRARRGDPRRQAAAFIGVNLLSLSLSTVLVVVLARFGGPFPAEVVATAITAGVTFLCYRSLVFR